MSPNMQVKLYRVLQESKVRPLGSTEEIDIDVRVIAATNRDLEKAIAAEEFREDLFYRISVIPIHLPALRERREDISLMVRAFLDRFRTVMGKPVQGIEPAAMAQLESYDWPGNVRELENTMERSVAPGNGADDLSGRAARKNPPLRPKRLAISSRISGTRCSAQRSAHRDQWRRGFGKADPGHRARIYPGGAGRFRRRGGTRALPNS